MQGADSPREERGEHPVPAGGQQVGPGREAPRAAGRMPRARASLAGALRRDLRQDARQRRQGKPTAYSAYTQAVRVAKLLVRMTT